MWGQCSSQLYLWNISAASQQQLAFHVYLLKWHTVCIEGFVSAHPPVGLRWLERADLGRKGAARDWESQPTVGNATRGRTRRHHLGYSSHWGPGGGGDAFSFSHRSLRCLHCSPTQSQPLHLLGGEVDLHTVQFFMLTHKVPSSSVQPLVLGSSLVCSLSRLLTSGIWGIMSLHFLQRAVG